MKINIYSGYGVRMQTVLLWKDFFTRNFPEVEVHFVDNKTVLKGKPSALLFPGGSASKFAKSLGEETREKIRRWIHKGGKYIGVCAGAYLASESYNWSLGISPVKILQPWERGHHQTRIQTNEGYQRVEYYNGPVFGEWGRDIRVLARFADGVLDNVEGHSTIGSPAILTNRCGLGSVLLLSPHLEKTPGMEEDLAYLIQDLLDDK